MNLNKRRYPLRASAARASSAIGAQTASETRSRSVSPTPESRTQSSRVTTRTRTTAPARKKQKLSNSRKVSIDDAEADIAYAPTSENKEDDSGVEPSESSGDEEIVPVRAPRDGSSRSAIKKGRRGARSSRSAVTKGRRGSVKQTVKESAVRDSASPGASVVKETDSQNASTLNNHQAQMLSKYFSEFDLHGNGRFTITDIRRVADDYGMDLTLEEAANMLRFWDKSGTHTISREAFTHIAVDSKFVNVTDG